MPALHPVSSVRHAEKRWQRYTSYKFAAADAVAPLTIQELPKAAISLPIGFLQIDTGFIPVAVQGLGTGKNLWITLDGRWVGGYIPACYRSYPFQLAPTSDGQLLLCVDEDSELIVEASTGVGESFHGDDGQLSSALKSVLDFLGKVAGNRELTLKICAQLQAHELIQPWVLNVQSGDQKRNLTGLFRIDEGALQKLSGEALQELMLSGALLMAYCQLLSMQHMPVLGQLAEAHAKAAEMAAAASAPVASKTLDLEFLNQSDTISFGGL